MLFKNSPVFSGRNWIHIFFILSVPFSSVHSATCIAVPSHQNDNLWSSFISSFSLSTVLSNSTCRNVYTDCVISLQCHVRFAYLHKLGCGLLVCCGLMYDALTLSDCIVLSGRVNGELKRIWKEVVMASWYWGILLKPSIKESRFAGKYSNLALLDTCLRVI
jgi:hypothetical protein